LTGLSFATWFRSQVTPNQRSPTIDIHQSHMPSACGCRTRHTKNMMIATNLIKLSNLLLTKEEQELKDQLTDIGGLAL
jgi:hypothetical protein